MVIPASDRVLVPPHLVFEFPMQAGVGAPHIPEVLPQNLAVPAAPVHVERAEQVRGEGSVVPNRFFQELDPDPKRIALSGCCCCICCVQQ